MGKTAWVFGVVVLIAGCQSDSTVVGPAGQKIHRAKCNGSADGCFNKAAATCKGSYQVLDGSSNSGGLVADVLPGPVTWYSMSYQCGPSDGRMPQFPFRGQSYVPPPVVMTQPAAPRPPLNCTSTLSGTFVGQPNHVQTSCY